MAKKHASALHDLFVSLRRAIVLVVTAFALAMEWPLQVVAVRALILWATLAIISHAAEILFQYLTHRAMIQDSLSRPTDSTTGAARS